MKCNEGGNSLCTSPRCLTLRQNDPNSPVLGSRVWPLVPCVGLEMAGETNSGVLRLGWATVTGPSHVNSKPNKEDCGVKQGSRWMIVIDCLHPLTGPAHGRAAPACTRLGPDDGHSFFPHGMAAVSAENERDKRGIRSGSHHIRCGFV